MPQVKLKIAIWTNDKFSPLFDSYATLEKRVELLKTAVARAREWLDAPSEEGALKIFIAPEYLLVDSKVVDPKCDRARAVSFEDFQAYCQEDKEQKIYEGVLPELSRGLLLIPGTVLLKKPLQPGRDFKLGEYDARFKSFQGADASLSESQREQRAGQQMTDLKRKIGHLQGEGEEGRDAQVVRNIALVFFDGELLFKYKKQAEYKYGKKTRELSRGDKLQHTSIKFLPGRKEGVFALPVGGGSVTCGIEICMDHNAGQLLQGERSQDVQLQFIVSDYVRNEKKHAAVKPGGYIIHASTAKDMSGVFDHDFNSAGTTTAAPPRVKLERGELILQEHLLNLPL